MQDKTFYEDAYVRLTDTAIIIKRYYFPCGNKTIPYESIQRIVGKERKWWNTKLWGMTLSKYWWPLDIWRLNKKCFLAIDVGSWVHIGLTTSVDSLGEDNPVVMILMSKCPGVFTTGNVHLLGSGAEITGKRNIKYE